MYIYEAGPWDWNTLLWHVVQVVVYVLLGLGLFGAAFLLIKKVTPFSIRKELEDDQNTALAIVIGSVFLGIAVILAAAIKS
jgi:putative membrane protein